MAENQSVDKFEKKVLFSVVRGFSLLMGAVGILMLSCGAFMLVKSWMSMSHKTNVSVSYQEVQQQVAETEKQQQPEGTENPSPTPSEEQVVVSPLEKKRDAIIDAIAGMIVKDNPEISKERVNEILLEKVANLDDEKTVAYFEEMKKVLEKAPDGKKPAFTDGFIAVYGNKLAEANARADEKRFEAIKNLGTYAYVTITGLMTVVSFGIILILAAIERNTRRSV